MARTVTNAAVGLIEMTPALISAMAATPIGIITKSAGSLLDAPRGKGTNSQQIFAARAVLIPDNPHIEYHCGYFWHYTTAKMKTPGTRAFPRACRTMDIESKKPATLIDAAIATDLPFAVLAQKIETLERRLANLPYELQYITDRHNNLAQRVETIECRLDNIARNFQDRLGEPGSQWPPTGIEARLLKLEQQMNNIMYIPDAPQHASLGEQFRALAVLETRVRGLEAGPIEPLPVDPPEYKPQ
jgi:hypothetical protein